MASDRYTLDANVLVYAVDTTDPGRQSRAQDVIARSYGRDCVLTVQALGEFYTVVTRKGLLSRALAASMVVDWRRTFALAAANADSLMRAMIAERRFGLSFWDAMLWATVRAAGCRLILTEDFQPGRTIVGVRFANPFGADPLPPEIERVLARA